MLFIPVDVHVTRIACNLGLTRRSDPSWKTSEEITTFLRTFDPNDPVKYDVAICHFGVSGKCPSRRSEPICSQCDLQSVCQQWRRSRSKKKQAR
ncbi:MAG: DUF2400 family protein [Myxococcota bacterium]